MAQLRLQDEVSRLEGSLAEHSGCSEPGHRRSTVLPPYVVPDGRTLCDHLNVVKQLAASSRFIVVIPIDGLHCHSFHFQFSSSFSFSFVFASLMILGSVSVCLSHAGTA